MLEKLRTVLVVSFIGATLMIMPACAKQAVLQKKEPLTNTNQAEIDRQKELERERQRKEAQQREFQSAKIKFMYEDVYFEKGRYRLQPEAREILNRKAEFLKKYPQISVIIEGHTDDRGSKESSFALGDRRAGEVKSFLIRKGIETQRLIAVSFGRERPIDTGKSEESRAKNRRVHFVVQE
ncbi:MAG: OmpA family protein [Desulfobacterales bacterium]|jgi:peptidoglycan-associated lipoprotein